MIKEKQHKKAVQHTAHKPKRKFNYKLIITAVAVITTIAYLLTVILNDQSITDLVYKLTIAVFLFIMASLIGMINLTSVNKQTNIITNVCLGLITAFAGVNIYLNNQRVVFESKNEVINLNNMNLAEAMKWAKEKKITLEQKYEYSDIIPLNFVIGQSVPEGTDIKEARNILIYISSGPDYNKETNAMNMVGWPVNDVVRYIKDNHLANVNIDYVYDPAVKKDNLISQSRTGIMKRIDELNLVFSWGPEGSLKPVKMINLVDKSTFDANLWLKRNGFKYELTKEFSSKIIKDNVTSQSVVTGKTIDPTKTTIKIGISKGKKIVVPDLMTMEVDEISAWVVKYKLRLSLTDAYHESIALDKIISANFKKGDNIEEGTTIVIVKSKGQLIMTDATTLSAITAWANTYSIAISQKFEYSTKAKGDIISISHKAGQVIKPGEVISISISQGQPVTVPTFIGKSWTSIKSTCTSLKLTCTSVYGWYSSTPKDYATAQSVSSGSKVMAGTSVKVTLSKGPTQTCSITLMSGWLGGSDAASVIRTNLANAAADKGCGDVTFNISSRSMDGMSTGYIHPDSPNFVGTTTKSVTSGSSYSIILTQ